MSHLPEEGKHGSRLHAMKQTTPLLPFRSALSALSALSANRFSSFPPPLAPCGNKLCAWNKLCASCFFVCAGVLVSVVVGNAVVNCRLSRQHSRR